MCVSIFPIVCVTHVFVSSTHIVSSHLSLLKQSSYIHQIETELCAARAHISHLHESVSTLVRDVCVPFQTLSQSSYALANVQSALQMLENVRRVVKLCEKLRRHIDAGPGDMAKGVCVCIINREIVCVWCARALCVEVLSYRASVCVIEFDRRGIRAVKIAYAPVCV